LKNFFRRDVMFNNVHSNVLQLINLVQYSTMINIIKTNFQKSSPQQEDLITIWRASPKITFHSPRQPESEFT
jgi:hypothetical protein